VHANRRENKYLLWFAGRARDPEGLSSPHPQHIRWDEHDLS
jgi:hypothetical protein